MLLSDNATGIGRRVFGQMRQTELSVRFRMHYGFTVRFANIGSGWEKGCVENAVGAFRRNMMVPPLRIDRSLPDYNTHVMLPMSFGFRKDKPHYIKGEPVGRLHEKDREALLALPLRPYDVRRMDTMRTNGVGTVVLDGSHRYTFGHRYSNYQVIVVRTAWNVAFHTIQGVSVKESERKYGDHTQDYDLESLPGSLVYKPNAWMNSPVRDAMGDGGFRDYLDSITGKDRIHALYLPNQTSVRFGFPLSSYAFNMLSRNGKIPDGADVQALCLRLGSFPPDQEDNDTGVNLAVFDQLLGKDVKHAIWEAGDPGCEG